MIGIIDYGMGNLQSVENALKYLGINSKRVHTKEEINECKGLILPGVGAFPHAMENFKKSGLEEPLRERVSAGVPLFGICLGMQLLFNYSYEGQEVQGEGFKTAGLGFIPGEVKKLYGDVKIPHMGWNSLIINESYKPRAIEGVADKISSKDILRGIEEGSYVYFVHSYYGVMEDEQDLVCYSIYGDVKVPAIVRKGNVMGAQFHPEKSGDIGLNILKNFVEMVEAQ